MTGAGGITAGGLILLFGWIGVRAILVLADGLAGEIDRFFDPGGVWTGECPTTATRSPSPCRGGMGGEDVGAGHGGRCAGETIGGKGGNPPIFAAPVEWDRREGEMSHG